MAVELTEAFLSHAAGWEAMKHARAYLQQGQVLSSNWTPPLLRGVVRAGEISFRASLVVKGPIDLENLCTCREAREWGKICAHVVAVGLHWLDRQKGNEPHSKVSPRVATPSVAPAARKPSGLQRDPKGEPAELFLILPPNLEQAISRGKVMLVFEAKWGGGRCPLNALPKGRTFAFSPADTAVLERIEEIANGETPAVLQLEAADFAGLLPLLAGQPNITLGKAHAVTITRTPCRLPLRATLETYGEIVLGLKDSTTPLTRVGNWVWQNHAFQPLGLPPGIGEVFRGPVRITRAQVPQFLNQHWPQLAAGGVEANFKLEDFTLEPQAPRFLLELRGGLAQLSALLQCAYGARIMTIGVTAADEMVWLPDPASPTRYSTRALNAERAALARLQRCGFSGGGERLLLLGQNAVLNFFARELPRL
jgi:hypothetical protein